ncbi:MAG: enoyl-CoA hydratase-related protein [Chloroflexi bacterium]|nr:enoyl-CoA hydratase-related protein [Chloroflexota bacterium]
MDVKKVGVVGCGLMGSGVAQVAAQSGYLTVVREINDQLLQAGLARIRDSLDKGVEKKKLSPAKRDATWGRIQGTTDMKDLADCDLVIEVIVEDLQAKKQLFKELDGLCQAGTVFASNTSSLSIADMAAVTGRPGTVAGLHYFFPSLINPLVEVIATQQTEPAVIEALLGFARVTGKIPIQVMDVPGFAVNRYFVPWLNEGVRMLDEGLADIPSIDAAAKEAFQIGMGPFALINATGLPIGYHAAESLAVALGEFYAPAAGYTARFKAGKPWDLEGEPKPAAKTEIGERLMGVVFGLAAGLVEEGAAAVEDINRGALTGLRWPRGPFEMMNEMGPKRALELVEKVAARHPTFKVPQLLRQMAAAGQSWELRDVKLDVRDGVATILMNRPEAMNALNEKVLGELKQVIAQVRDDPAVRAVILTGEGAAFVAGADIRAMLSKKHAEIAEFIRFGQEVLNEVEALPKPVIAAINGFALGGGLELALACDIRLASTESRMGFPEVGLGIFPGFGGTQRAPRAIGKGQAAELIFTGDQIGAEEAVRIGLVNRAVPPTQLMAEARRLAERIARQGPIAVARAKGAINQTVLTGQDAGLKYERDVVTSTFGTEDQKEGMTAFLERRKPQFKGK